VSSRPEKKRYTPHKNRPEKAHFGRILNLYAKRENDPIWEITDERMHNDIVIKSVG